MNDENDSEMWVCESTAAQCYI